MYEQFQENPYTITENNRYTNKETENIFNTFIDHSQKLTNSNENSKNTYKNLIHNISHKYKNNLNVLNTERSKNSVISKRKETLDTITQSYTKSNIPPINKYYAKVIVENFRQPKDILFLFDNFITENNYQKYYDINQELNKITFIFYEEDIAFNLTKVLNSHKNKNSLYSDMKVNLSLTPNDNYNKNNFGTIKRRGISTDTIQRLFQGIGGRKRERKGPKKKLNVLIHSPFYSLNKKLKMSDEQSSKDNLKDYNRFPIRVLDDDYRPLCDYNFRSEEKSKWISPSKFLI